MIKLLEYEDTLPPLSSSDNAEHERIRNDRKSGLLVACVVIEVLRVVALFTSTILAGIGFYNLGKSAQQGSLQIGLFVGILLSFTIAVIVLFTSRRKIFFLPTLIISLTVSLWLHTEGILSVGIEWSMAFPVFLLVILTLLGISGYIFSALFFNKFYDFDVKEDGNFKMRLKDRLTKGLLTFIKPETLIFFFFMVGTSIAIILLDGHSFTANLLAFFHTEHEDKKLEDDDIYTSLQSQIQKLETNIENEKKTLRDEKMGVFEGLKRQNLLTINSLQNRRVRKEDKPAIDYQILGLKKQIQADSIKAIADMAKEEKKIDSKYEKTLSKLRGDIIERTNQINDGNITGQKKSDNSKKSIEMAGYGLAKFNEPFFIFLTFVSLHFRRKLAFRLVSKMKLNQGSIIGRMFYTLKISFQKHIHTFIQEWDELLLGKDDAKKLEGIPITSISDIQLAAQTTIKVWDKDEAEKLFRAKLLKTFERGYKPLDGIAEHKINTRKISNQNNRNRFNSLLSEFEDNTGWTVEIDYSQSITSMTDNGETWDRPQFILKKKEILSAIA